MTPREMILELRALGRLQHGREWRVADEWRPAHPSTDALPCVRGRATAGGGVDVLAVVDVSGSRAVWRAWTGTGWRSSEAVSVEAARMAADEVLLEQGWLLL